MATQDRTPTGRLDLAAFAAEHGAALTRFAFLLTGRREDAEDLVQSVLLQMSRLDDRPVSHPPAYARRAILNLHRSVGRRSSAHLRALVRGGHGIAAPVSDDAQTLAERDALWAALGVLSSRQRAAIVLRYYEDWDDEAIGEVLGCAPGTVRSLVSRALPRLREHLVPDHHTTAPGGTDA